MSYPKHFREDVNKTGAAKNLAVVSKCLAIVLVPKSGNGGVGNLGKGSESNVLEDGDAADQTMVDPSDGNVIQSSEVRKALSPGGYSGKELLQDFKLRNKTCYWNPSLVESIKCLECKGFVEPCTILVTAPDIHLENLRSAWARRVLKAPAGFVIERIGDVSGIEMQVIPQTQFIPLPDALCSIIMELNSQRTVATLESISDKLTAWSRDMRVPSQQLVFDMLSNLIQERKVFHTGSGYFVVTPDTSRLQNSLNTGGYLPSNASWLPYHPMYIPVFQGQAGPPSLLLPPARAANMRSISCQVTTIEESSEEEKTKVVQKDQDKIIKASSDHKSSRSNSLRKKDGKDSDVKSDVRTSRSNSLRRKEDTKLSRDGPGETIVTEQTGQLKRSASLKTKGEKTKATQLPNQKVESTIPVKEKEEKRSIFSKLFNRKKKNKVKDKILMPPPLPPPPASRAPSVVSGSGAASDGKADKEYGTFSAQFPPPEWVWYHQQLEKQKRTESWVTQQSNKPTQPPPPAKTTSRPPTGHRHNPSSEYNHPVAGKPHHRSQHPSVLERVSMNGLGHSQDQVTVNDDIPSKYGHTGEIVNPHLVRTGNVYESFRNPAGVRSHHHHRTSRDLENGGQDRKQQLAAPSEYAVIDHGETTALQDSVVYRSVSALSPVAHLHDESMYVKLVEQHKLGPRHSTPRYEGDTEHPAYRTDAFDHHPQRRKSHRTHRKPQRLYSYYEGQGDDISYEYKGRLPNKNSSRAQSRDSGVNCVGLTGGELTQKQPDAVYENAPNNVHLYNTQHQNQRQPTSIPSAALVQYSTNQTSPTTNSTTDSLVNYCDTTNAAYNSVVYGSHVTDICGVSSVLHKTLASSTCDSCHIHLPQNSLASTFYKDGVEDVSPPHLFICKAEINPKVSHDVLELHQSPETVDLTDSAPEAAGRVASAARGLSEKVSALNKEMEQASKSATLDSADDCEYEPKIQPDHSNVPVTNLCDVQNSNNTYFNKGPANEWQLGNIDQNHPVSGAAQRTETPSQEVEIGAGTLFSSTASVDVRDPAFLNSVQALVVVDSVREPGVPDSGFNSPMNPELLAHRRCQPSNQSNSASEISEEQHHLLNGVSGREDPLLRGDNQTPQSSTNGSSDHHSHSDVYMVTGSEHHSGSTNDDSIAPDQVIQQAPEATLVARIKHSGSHNSIKSQNYLPHSQSYNCLQQPQRLSHAYPHPTHLPYSMPPPLNQNLVPHYQHTAKLVPYPDVYNNNSGSTSSALYVDQNYPFLLSYPPPHSQSHQKLAHYKQVKRERPRSVDLWKQQSPSQLHKFQEEQLTRKYGANGEYEVMGVL